MSEAFQPAGRAPAPPPLDLVQDFVNTEIPEWARDDIATPALLARWLEARGLLAAGETVGGDNFVAARELRSALRSLALLNTTGEGEDHSGLGLAFSRIRLGVDVDVHGRLVTVPTGEAASRALASIVAIVLDAQASGSWGRLKACRKESCGWLFYDGSRNRSSNWCSMSICGNRVKTASYRRRHKAAP